MQIEQILDKLETVGKRKTPRIIWESVLYYYASIMMNKYNFRKQIGSRDFIRYYSIIFSSSGTGKALANSEPVLTNNGWKNMGELVLSDKVIGSNGLPTSINSIHPQGLRNIYTVTLKDGTSVNCDIEHLWTVTNGDGRKQTITVRDMLNTWISKDNFDKRYGTYQKKYNYSIPYAEPSHFGSDKSIDIDPYLLGLLLGDGGFRGQESAISFTNGNINLVNELEKRLPGKDKIGYKKFIHGAWHIRIRTEKQRSTTETYKLIKAHGLNNLKSKDKFIPKVYLTGSLKTRQELYRGLIDTDGYTKNGKMLEYSTSSKQLAEDILELGRSIGKILSIGQRIPTYTHNGQKKKGLLNYRIRELKKYKKGKSIIDISYSHAEPATCITIDSKDHLFVTNGYNLTHNSFVLNKIESMCNLDMYGKLMAAYFKQNMAALPEATDNADEILRYMPKSVTLGVEGTAEGLFHVTQSQASSMFGSLNLATDEFGEVIGSSAGLLSKLKELYDGQFKAKIIKGDTSEEMKGDINDIICNFIGLGSRKGVTADSEKELKRIATSGMYRRTFIIETKEMVEKNRMPEDIKDLQEYLDQLNETWKQDFIERRKLDTLSIKPMTFTEGYPDALEEVDDDLIKRAQDDQLNEFAQYNTGSLEMVIDLSHIIAFLEWDTEVTEKHLKKAYDFMTRTRASVENTFKTVHPYRLMYDLLKLKNNMTVSEMAEIENHIPIMATKVRDNIDFLEELCYRKDEVLIKSEGKVTRYRIEELPKTNLDKIIVSLSTDNRLEKSVEFQAHKIRWDQLKKLVVSQKTQCFTTAHFEENYRAKKNFIEGQNLIAFDIDEEMTIADAQEVFSHYTYLIYTTKSHQIKKGDKDAMDRFRIILPTKTTYYVTEDQHKRMYENLAEGLDVHNDTQTKNVSRLWFTNPDATIIEHHGDKLLDVTPYIPDTIKSENIMPMVTNVNEQVESGEIGRREAGFIKWFLTNTGEGNRHENLTNAYYFFRDLGSDPVDKVNRLNQMLLTPMADHEMKYIYSIGKK